MSNIKDGVEDINDKMKAAVKAVANKVKDSGIDTGTQYRRDRYCYFYFFYLYFN